MMSLILAPKPIKGIEEKPLKSRDRKSGQKYSKNHKNDQHCSTIYEMIYPKSTAILMQVKSLQGVEIATTSSHSMEDWRDLSLSLLSSLTP
jgi:hypothetical protein